MHAKVSREELTRRLQDLSDGELVRHLREGTLIPAALEIAEEIVRSRGLSSACTENEPCVPDPHDEPSIEDGADGTLVTIADQLAPLEAGVMRACLESQGIFVHVWGEHLATTHIVWSIAAGRSKLQVRPDQVEHAREVLAAYRRGDLRSPELESEEAPVEATETKQPPSGDPGRLMVRILLAVLCILFVIPLGLIGIALIRAVIR
jgi:hypothetical protein